MESEEQGTPAGFAAEAVLSRVLSSVSLLFHFHGQGFDTDAARRELSGSTNDLPSELVRVIRARGLKARALRTSPERLARLPLPALAFARDGGCFVLARMEGERVLVHTDQPGVWSLDDLQERWSGEVILITRRITLSDLGRAFDITWFMAAVYKYRHILGEVLVASLALQVFGLVSPLFFQVVVDKVLVHRGVSTLDVLVIGLVAVSVFETVLGALRTYIFSHTTNRIDVELGARLFKHLMSLPMAYFSTRRVGDSVARVRELENIRQFITGSALTLVVDLLFTGVFLAVMAWYSLPLTGVVVLSLPVYIGISVAVTPLFRHRLDEKFRRGAENQAFLVESVTAVETLKAMAVEPQMQRHWETQLAGYVSSSFAVSNLSNLASQGIQSISKLVTAALLFFGAKAVKGGSLSVGELVAFNMLAGRVAQPVLRLAQVWQDFHQARLSIQRLGDILNTPSEPQVAAGRTALPAIRGDIQFDHVQFRYRPDGQEVLKDISLHIPAGQVVGIVGSSGSGKSSLARLVQRLYVPQSGRVLVDGVDLSLVDPGWLRRQVGVVLQENVLLNQSIRDNIALGDPGMPLERVLMAAQLAGAHEFILELPEGYDTVIGERGASLSGGQRQRIAIARALVGNPRVLIFDEATSALDYESEHIVQNNMRAICAGRTVIIIAHRLSTVRGCHRIITLDHGRLIEDGSHDELIRKGGRYAHLHALQGGTTHAAE